MQPNPSWWTFGLLTNESSFQLQIQLLGLGGLSDHEGASPTGGRKPQNLDGTRQRLGDAQALQSENE